MNKLLRCRNHPRLEETEVGAGEGLEVAVDPLQRNKFIKPCL